MSNIFATPLAIIPIKSNNSAKVISQLLNQDIISNERCCGEAGTFAVARADITQQIKFKKETETKKDLTNIKPNQPMKMLTTYPLADKAYHAIKPQPILSLFIQLNSSPNKELGKH